MNWNNNFTIRINERKLNGLLTIVILFILGSVVFAATPNPGHSWIEVGDGAWAATGTTGYRTFTFPNATATVMTTLDIVQGDLIYGSAASTTTRLPKDTNATRYLSNTGASNNPAWSQVNISNGVTGNLPLANGGTNATLAASNGGVLYSDASALAILTGNGTADKILLSGASVAPTWSTATYPETSGSNGYLLLSDGTNWFADNSTTTTVATKAAFSNATLGTLLTNSFNSSTTFKIGLFTVPQQITVNQVSVSIGTVTTAARVKMCIYNEGGSLVINSTTTNNVVANQTATSSVSSIVLYPGNYYFAAGCAANCTLQLKTWGQTAIGPFDTLIPAGKKVYTGRVTMTTPGQCNSTLGTITSEASTTPIGRLDN